LLNEEFHVMALRLRLEGDAKGKLVAEPVWGPQPIAAGDGNGP
jgi:hypothetical protein